MILDVSHRTEYSFGTSPNYGLQQIRLTPQTQFGQEILDWSLTVEGGTVEAVFTDYNRNTVHLVKIAEGAVKLAIRSKGRVDMRDVGGVYGANVGHAPLWLFKRQTPLTRVGAGVAALVKSVRSSDGSDLDTLHTLSRDISRAVTYATGQTDALTTAEQAIAAGAGVCQDHAHIFISAAREAGFPARYVSGYLMMNDRVAQDATHAWAEAHIDGLGWTGFDVSNGISPDARYVRVATGLDYSGAAPISGLTFGGLDETIQVDVQVQQ